MYLHALLFLCFHYLSDVQKAQETLETLEHILEIGYLIRNGRYSDACMIVGACYETCSDYINARRCYQKACNAGLVSPMARYRLERLETDLIT